MKMENVKNIPVLIVTISMIINVIIQMMDIIIQLILKKVKVNHVKIQQIVKNIMEQNMILLFGKSEDVRNMMLKLKIKCGKFLNFSKKNQILFKNLGRLL